MVTKLVLIRHGESTWNLENRFTGWTDVDLTENGVREAHDAGKLMKAEGLTFDVAYSSVLKRAIRTLWISLDELDLMYLPIKFSWRLNERHYGALQGLNKAETAEKYGAEQVQLWRRSYDVLPPALEMDDPRHARFDPRYSLMDPTLLPACESLKTTLARFLPYWGEEILPNLKTGKKILVVAHGNSIRALVKHLDGISDEDIPGLNIPTGIPLVYEFDDQFKPIRHYYLGDARAAEEKAQAVARQAERKK